MNFNLNYRFGYRAIKTSIAVFLCFIITIYITHGSPFYAAIATVICIQQTHEKTIQMGMHRFIGTVIGGFLGFVFLEVGVHIPGFFDNLYILVVPFVSLLAIYICNVLNITAATSICCIVLINIISNYERGVTNSFHYVTDRVFETTIGIIVAVLVNRFCFPKASLEDNKSEH